MKKIRPWMVGLLLLLALPLLLSFFWLHVPRTVRFDAGLPYTEINGGSATLRVINCGLGIRLYAYQPPPPTASTASNHKPILAERPGLPLIQPSAMAKPLKEA